MTFSVFRFFFQPYLIQVAVWKRLFPSIWLHKSAPAAIEINAAQVNTQTNVGSIITLFSYFMFYGEGMGVI